MSLLIHEVGHVLIYFLVLAVIFLVVKYFEITLITTKNILIGLAVTVGLDFDHFFDYFLYRGIAFNTAEFFSSSHFVSSGKIIIPLHSWEFATTLFIIYFLVRKRISLDWLFFVAIGISVHLIYDTLFYSFNPLVYLIFYRAYYNFMSELFKL